MWDCGNVVSFPICGQLNTIPFNWWFCEEIPIRLPEVSLSVACLFISTFRYLKYHLHINTFYLYFNSYWTLICFHSCIWHSIILMLCFIFVENSQEECCSLFDFLYLFFVLNNSNSLYFGCGSVLQTGVWSVQTQVDWVFVHVTDSLSREKRPRPIQANRQKETCFNNVLINLGSSVFTFSI